jgi:hypothetical protein
LSRPIIDRLRSESDQLNRITPQENRQRLSQQNLHEAADPECPLHGRFWGCSGHRADIGKRPVLTQLRH